MAGHNDKRLTFYDLMEKIGDCEQSHMHTMVTNISAMKGLFYESLILAQYIILLSTDCTVIFFLSAFFFFSALSNIYIVLVLYKLKNLHLLTELVHLMGISSKRKCFQKQLSR